MMKRSLPISKSKVGDAPEIWFCFMSSATSDFAKSIIIAGLER